jgi:hypothetical protein
VDADGGEAECIICFEEYEAGDKMARLVCWCKFHEVCTDDLDSGEIRANAGPRNVSRIGGGRRGEERVQRISYTTRSRGGIDLRTRLGVWTFCDEEVTFFLALLTWYIPHTSFYHASHSTSYFWHVGCAGEHNCALVNHNSYFTFYQTHPAFVMLRCYHNTSSRLIRYALLR